MLRGQTNNPAGNPAGLAQLTPEQRALGRLRGSRTKTAMMREATSEEFGGMPYEQAHALRLKYYSKGYHKGRRKPLAIIEALKREIAALREQLDRAARRAA